jgi:glucosamine--fructose-6-phosphate aminotransferase (isomerizing)
MVACCKDMPLLIGLGARACFAASDMISFSDKCKEYFALDNGDTAVIKGNDVSLMDKDGHPKPIQLRPVTSQFEQANSGNYPHFMIKEILEQPETILRALSLDNVMLETLAAKILDAKQIVFVGCGSSRHAGLLGRYLFSTIGKKFSDVIIGSEFKYYAESMNSNSLVIAISQSGETADILEGVREARKLGAKVISIINRENSQLARSSDWVIHMNCGPEISVAATKSFTSQLTVLYLLSYAMINQLEAAKAKLGLVVNQIEQVIQRSHRSIEALAYSLKAAQQCYFIARGSSFHIAIEAALKLKETAYIHSEGMPAGELKHGTLALVEAGVPFIAICPRDQTFNDMMANINEVKARGAAIIGVSDIHEEVFDHWIEIAKVEPIFYSLACIVPLQLLAYYSAVARGLNPDKPRNLAKCVTVG